MKGSSLIKKASVAAVFICAIAIAIGYKMTGKAESFEAIAQDYKAKIFEYWPEAGLMQGESNVALDRFGDYSLAGQRAWEKEEDKMLRRLEDVDPARLSHSEKLTYALLQSALKNTVAARVCKTELWNVSPLTGWHNTMVEIMDVQPSGTPELREKALKRWRTFAKVSQAELAKLRQGLKEGYVAPKPAVERVISQLELMVTEDAKDSPFYSIAKADKDETFSNQVVQLIQKIINPELKQHIEFLKNTYFPKARNEVGTYAIPNGLACYQASLKLHNTLDKTPQEIHQIGLDHMEKIKGEVAVIGERLYGTTDLKTVFEKARIESTGDFKTEQDMLDYDHLALNRVKAKLDQWFDKTPQNKGIVKPYPLHRAKTGAPGEYSPPNDKGTKPGIYYMNTYQPEKASRIDLEATLFHELIPGHHLQIALQVESKSINPLNKFLASSGFVEGWALYAERLADEMDVYRDEISKLGMLSNEAMRASRLVVDTGMHALGWTRAKAIEYMKSHTAANGSIIEGEVDRYIMFPGQATAYMLGKLEIESLRDEAKQRLGERFNIREFHNRVLENGAVTLPMLAQQIHDWIDAGSSASRN